LNVHGVNDVKQTEIHTAEPLVPELSSFEFEIAIEELKTYKSLGIDLILAELIQARGNTLCSRSTNLFILFEIRKNFQSSGRNLLLYVFVRRVIKLMRNY
jgi:hypothetical protein